MTDIEQVTVRSRVLNWFTIAPLGTVSICIEATAFLFSLFFLSALGEYLSRHLFPSAESQLMQALLIAFMCSVPISIAGLFIDKKKSIAVFVLISIFPCLMFMGMWAGYW